MISLSILILGLQLRMLRILNFVTDTHLREGYGTLSFQTEVFQKPVSYNFLHFQQSDLLKKVPGQFDCHQQKYAKERFKGSSFWRLMCQSSLILR